MRDFEVRLAWAEQHTQAFEHNVRLWRQGGGYGPVFEPKPDSHGEHIIKLRAEEPPVVLSLNVGDALFAMRSALDHLAFELARAHTDPLPDKAAETSEFPIFHDRPMTSAERQRKIGAMHPDAATVIEGLQPHLCANHTQNALWQLHEAARIDRHRLLHVTLAVFSGLGIDGDNLRVESMSLGYIGPGLEDGAELGTCSVRPIDPGRPMHMNLTPEPELTFKDGPGAGRPVVGFLTDCLGHIRDEIVPPLQPFL